jgi:hypothetical protein
MLRRTQRPRHVPYCARRWRATRKEQHSRSWARLLQFGRRPKGGEWAYAGHRGNTVLSRRRFPPPWKRNGDCHRLRAGGGTLTNRPRGASGGMETARRRMGCGAERTSAVRGAHGRAGMGKTRLALEFARSIAAQATVLVGHLSAKDWCRTHRLSRCCNGSRASLLRRPCRRNWHVSTAVRNWVSSSRRSPRMCAKASRRCPPPQKATARARRQPKRAAVCGRTTLLLFAR